MQRIHVEAITFGQRQASAADGGKDIERGRARRWLEERYKIESLFVRVPTLAQVLGLSTSAIYASIMEGRFMLPSRMLGSMPVVKFDDLLDWYCGGDEARCAAQATAVPGAEPANQSSMDDERKKFVARVEEKNRLVAEVLAEMGIGESMGRL